jgi:hypothetical protein
MSIKYCPSYVRCGVDGGARERQQARRWNELKSELRYVMRPLKISTSGGSNIFSFYSSKKANACFLLHAFR